MVKLGKFTLKLKSRQQKEQTKEAEQKVDDTEVIEREIRDRLLSLGTEYKILETYPIEDPWARVHILEHKKTGSLLYFVDEIPLTKDEEEAYNKILSILYWELEPPQPGDDPREHFEKQAKKIVAKFKVRFGSTIHPGISWGKIEYYLLRNTIGYGPINVIMKDQYIEDISCDGLGKPIYVWHQRYESIPTNIVFKKEEELDSLILKLAHKAGKHVSVAHPIVDAILPEGHRLAATYKKEVSTGGSTFTIRKFKDTPLSVIDLVRGRTLNSLLASYFWLLMEHNMTGMIMGVTGAGKTTMLNALATLLRPTIKVVTIEDTPELRLTLENWVQLVARPSYGFEKGASEITLYDLVKVSLRYRPDILVVGEVRGEEAKVLFQAIATGHGGISTIHAEDINAMVKRLMSPPMEIPEGYISLLNFALAIRRVKITNPDGTYKIARVVTDVWEVVDYNKFIQISKWDAATRKHKVDLESSMLLSKIGELTGRSIDDLLAEIDKRDMIIRWMAYEGITNYKRVGEIIGEYYRRPDKVLKEAARGLRRFEMYE